ncbi:MAG TPA: DUF4395 domain-containing protein [Gammaproteobacteria bacterium]
MSESRYVDHSAIKTGQLLAIATLVVAYVFNRWEPVAALALVFLITSLAFEWGPFALVYRLLLKPLGVVRPDLRTDNTQPHRFGQAVGAVSAALAAAALYFGYVTLGWVLVWVLIALTAVSYLGWCIGCFIYYQMNRLGVRGFFGHAPTDSQVVLGARPRRNME